jgi:uncharacterized repeat protein (TIGR03806 family)
VGKGARLVLRRVTLFALSLSLVACSGHGSGSSGSNGSSSSSTPPTTSAPTYVVSASTGTGTGTGAGAGAGAGTGTGTGTGAGTGTVAPLTSRLYVPDSALIPNACVPQTSPWIVERVFPGLKFQRPVYLTGAGDGSGRTFVCELKGVVTALAPGANPLTSAPATSVFLDLSSKVHYGTEEGLFSIAFHPQFAQNGFVFAVYSTGSSYVLGAADPVRVRLSRFSLVQGNPNALDPASEVVLLEIPKHYQNHNGGQIAFGPDGFLYMSVGDGGCCGDPERNAQNLGSLKGKILRIDTDSATPYACPKDNPFVGQAGAAPEIWAYGLRNPWRFSFDRANGRLWAADVGQDAWEEIDLITKGGNYGWSRFEGDHLYDGTIPAPGALAPLIEYDHDVGACVIGGYVYRGSRVPSLQGFYLFADYSSSRVFAARYDGTQIAANVAVTNTIAPAISSFGQDDAGEVYLLSYSTGLVYRVSSTGAPTNFPQTLSATGLFADLTTQTMRAETIPWGVLEPHWSDFAVMDRHVLLPHLDRVQVTPQDGWILPADSIVAKNFWLERTRGDPKTKAIVETRLLVNTQGQWYGYSYEWNDQGTDATLVEDSKYKPLSIQVNGQSVTQNWFFPSRSDCLRCHTQAAGYVLGLETAQLNSDYDYAALGGPIENQLTALDGFGVFSQPLGAAPSSLPKLVNHDDPNATLEQRARSYLHVNCSMCHRPDGGAPVDIDLRYDTPLAQTNLVGVAPESGDLGVAGALLVTKQNPQASVLYLRMANLGSSHMPPLASSIVDDDAVQLIGDWIQSIP